MRRLSDQPNPQPDPIRITAAYSGTYYLELSWDAQLDDDPGCLAAAEMRNATIVGCGSRFLRSP